MSNHYCRLMTAKKLDEIKTNKKVKRNDLDKDNLKSNIKTKKKTN